jgi:hypothetical protein
MSLTILEKFIPKNANFFLRQWIEHKHILFRITRERDSKLGDYQRLGDGSHKISINSTLSPDLFFFVLTHELAHLIARETFGYKILPHGEEWKSIYRKMLLESISAYPEDLQPLIFRFSKSPKANFMASTEMVHYFFKEKQKTEEVFLFELEIGHDFLYKNQKFKIFDRRKKNYLCKNLVNQKIFIFQPVASVIKIIEK